MKSMMADSTFSAAARNPSYYLVDYIIYRGSYNYTFYFKEVSVIDMFSPNKAHYVFRLPATINPQEMTVDELEGVWSKCENRPFVVYVIQKALKKYYGPFNFFFAMGKKSGFLQRFIKFPIFNLEFHGCPPTEVLQRSFLLEDRNKSAYCRHHKLDWPMGCSRLNTYCIKNWVLDNAERINMLSPQGRLATFTEWTIPQDPLPLAILGFVQINGTKAVICLFCRLYREEVHNVNQLIEDHAVLFVMFDHVSH